MANDKFSSSTYKYPLNIEADEYGGNYVMYQIGVNGRSSNVEYNGPYPLPSSMAKNSNLTGMQLNDNSINNYITAIPYVAAAGYAGISGAEGGAGAAGAAVFIALKSNEALNGAGISNYVTLKESIILYMPDVSIQYNATWDAKDLAFQAMGVKFAEQALSPEKLTSTFIGGAAGAVTGMALDQAIGIHPAIIAAIGAIEGSGIQSNTKLVKDMALNAGLTIDASQIVQKSLGISRNPMSELLFSSIDRRDFTHKFTFFPRSKAEANSVHEILRLFKYHMHPEFLQNGYNLNYIYPSEFYISYYTDNKQSKVLPKHAACALTKVDIDYVKGDQFSTLKDGSPAEISMTLHFTELALLTKESFSTGGLS